jgi:hypothetical protein
MPAIEAGGPERTFPGGARAVAGVLAVLSALALRGMRHTPFE